MQSKECYFSLPNQSIDDIPNDIQHLYLCGFIDSEQNELIISNNSFHFIKSITIGHKCFQSVRKFVIDGLESLEVVKIGRKSFKRNNSGHDDNICRITNCPNLRQLEIGDESFSDFKSFEISNVNSLQSIKLGNECFWYAEELSLKGE